MKDMDQGASQSDGAVIGHPGIIAGDPANLKPGEFAPIPATEQELLIEALRFANRVSGLLNEISTSVLRRIEDDDDNRFDDLVDLSCRRFSDCSAIHLFIAAHNIGLDLPPDLDSEPTDPQDD